MKVFIAISGIEYADYPDDVDPAEQVIGVYSSKEAAERAIAEDAAERWEEMDYEEPEDREPFMMQYSWSINEQEVRD